MTTMYARIIKPPKSSFFLLGMRGTGKSYWVKDTFKKAKFFDLLNETDFQRYLTDLSLFADELRLLPKGSWVVIDEVQRLPQILNEVHRAIEEHGLKFALLGSSARKLKRVGVNLLGGRALSRVMYPLLPDELKDDFSLESALHYGTLPLIVSSPDQRDQLEGYLKLYLREEIQLEALVRNLPGFARFLPIAGLFHGQTINVSELARSAGVARTTVDGYLDILEDTLLCYKLPAYEAKLRVKERTHPKLYWIDNGVARAAKGSLNKPTAEERGALFEGFIAMLLRAGKDLSFCDYDSLAYWLPPGGNTEVDFILTRGKEKIAIEVKSAKEPGSTELKGLKAIGELSGIKRRILVYPGKRDRLTQDKIEILGIETFLRQLSSGL